MKKLTAKATCKVLTGLDSLHTKYCKLSDRKRGIISWILDMLLS